MSSWIGIIGILLIIGLGVLLSRDRKAIAWKTVLAGIAIQLVMAFLVLKWNAGQLVLKAVSDFVVNIIGYTDEGSNFLFGWLVDTTDQNRYVFAFRVLPIVIFLSSLFSALYFLRIMPWIVKMFARFLTRLMGVSGAESLAAAANVFMGQTEAPILVAPYISKMTFSELMAMMTGGMATVSGAVLGGYIALGINPEYLITASIMAAPASLVMAKLLIPETGKALTAGRVELEIKDESVNIVDALSRGATQGLKLALNVAAMLIAFIAVVALLNGILGMICDWVGLSSLLGTEITFEKILGFLFAPLAFLLGVPWSEASQVGHLLGVKLVLNEFIAYVDLAEIKASLSPRAEVIATYALCGFANISSVGVQIGGIGALAPDRRADLARLGFRALLAGFGASMITAALAGLLT